MRHITPIPVHCIDHSIMPIDAVKTTLQVEGAGGLKQIGDKVSSRGPLVLFHGALAAAAATAVGHFPWFFTFNYLQEGIILSVSDLTASLPYPKFK